MERRIFVLGAKGMLGSMVATHLSGAGHAVVPLARSDFDALKETTDQLSERLSLQPTDVLVNAIGITDGNAPEEDLFRVNAELPKGLDALAARYGCTVVHTSTDGVFSGAQGGYWESLPTDATDPYGRSKQAGDQLSASVILRTSIIGPEDAGKHFISWVRAQDKQTTRGYTNHTWNGITTLTYAKILERFLTDGFPKAGLYHIFSPRILTKYDLVRSVAQTYDINLTLVPHHAPTPVMRHLATEHDLCASLELLDIDRQLADLRG